MTQTRDIDFQPFEREQPPSDEGYQPCIEMPLHRPKHSEEDLRALAKGLSNHPGAISPVLPGDPDANKIRQLQWNINMVLFKLRDTHGCIPDEADPLFCNMMESFADAIGQSRSFLDAMKGVRSK